MSLNTLESLIASAFASQMGLAGKECIYTPVGGAAKTVTGLLAPASDQLGTAEEFQRRIVRREFTIPRDATDGIPSPAVGDQVEIDGTVYAVEAIAELAAATALLRLVSLEQRRVGDGQIHTRRP